MIEGKLIIKIGDVTDIDKMKVVGKIGLEPTVLDINTASGNFQFNFSNLFLFI